MKNNRYRETFDKINGSEGFKKRMRDSLAMQNCDEEGFTEIVCHTEVAKPRSRGFSVAAAAAACIAVAALGAVGFAGVLSSSDGSDGQYTVPDKVWTTTKPNLSFTVGESNDEEISPAEQKAIDEAISAVSYHLNKNRDTTKLYYCSAGKDMLCADLKSEAGKGSVFEVNVSDFESVVDVAVKLREIKWCKLSDEEIKNSRIESLPYDNIYYLSTGDSNDRTYIISENFLAETDSSRGLKAVYRPRDTIYGEYRSWYYVCRRELDLMRYDDFKLMMLLGATGCSYVSADITAYEVIPMKTSADGSQTEDVVYELSGKMAKYAKSAQDFCVEAEGTRTAGGVTVSVEIKSDQNYAGEYRFVERSGGTIESIDKYRDISYESETGKYKVYGEYPAATSRPHLPADFSALYKSIYADIAEIEEITGESYKLLAETTSEQDKGNYKVEINCKNPDIQLCIEYKNNGLITNYSKTVGGKLVRKYDLNFIMYTAPTWTTIVD